MAEPESKPACRPVGPGVLPPTIWERLETTPPNPRTTLTHAQIAAEAVALADAEGLDAVSMRRLAERLGVATMALYRYVKSKDELLELMVDAVAGPEPLAADPSDWRAVFREVARRHRVGVLAHPWLVAANAQVPTLTPARLQVAESMLTALAPLPLTGEQRMQVIRALNAIAGGAADLEANQRMMLKARGHGEDGDIRLLLRSHMEWALRSGKYPMLVKTVQEGLAPVDPEQEFDLALDAMLDGLATRFGI